MSEQLPELAHWAGAATGAGLSAKLAWNVLGPASKALGRRLEQSIDEFHLERIVRVIRNASAKMGEADSADKEVSPRVLGRVVDESEWIDDAILVEYLGGVLASARTPLGRDDRGVTWTSMVRDMSAYTLRMHYAIYTCARQIYPGRIGSISEGAKLAAGRIFIPDRVLSEVMEFDPGEAKDPILQHSVFRLHALSLVGGGFAYSDTPEFLRDHGGVPHAEEGGLGVTPTPQGVELYMWGHGNGVRAIDEFLDPNLVFEQPEGIRVPYGAVLVSQMGSVDVSAMTPSDE